jgi:hypothetical protein
MKDARVLELVTFKAVAHVGSEQMVAAAAAVTPVLQKYDGFIHRAFAHADDGTWIDAVFWRDRVSAENAAKIVMSDPIAQAFFSLIDQGTMEFRHAAIAA